MQTHIIISTACVCRLPSMPKSLSECHTTIIAFVATFKASVTPDRTIAWTYDRLLFGERATDRQCLLRSPAAIAYCDRSFFRHRTIGRTRGRAINIDSIDCTIDRGPRRSIVWSIASGVGWGVTWTPETSPHCIVSVSNRLVVPPVARWHDQWHD